MHTRQNIWLKKDDALILFEGFLLFFKTSGYTALSPALPSFCRRELSTANSQETFTGPDMPRNKVFPTPPTLCLKKNLSLDRLVY